MKLSHVCIRQPVLAIVLSLIIVVLGLIGFQKLEIRFFPKLQLPIVTVTTYYDGASPQLMESQVTTPLENALSAVDNIQFISSSSTTSYSTITIQFLLGGDLEAEAAEVRDAVSGEQSLLPADAQAPSVYVGVVGNPIMALGFTATNKKPAAIRDFINRNIQPKLNQLPGMGWVSVLGASDYAMRIWLNAAQMAAEGVTVTDVKNALTANNIYFPAGSVQGPNRVYSIVSNTRLKNAEEFANIIVKQTSTGTVRMKDIANVDLGFTGLYDYPMRINGKNGIMLMVDPMQNANPITVANEVTDAMKNFQVTLPPGMHASVNFDLSHYLKSSINETFIAIGESILLVLIVVYLFLGSFRAASIPIVTIPVSLIGVFFIIKLLGFTINTMSLLGMVLAIGLVVDDAIVMMENIHRHIEAGMTPMQAALTGSKEIGFAVVAMSITLIAVYAPIGFIQGYNAELFKEFAFTLASAVVISGFVALTLSPMMCSRVLLAEEKMSRLSQWVDKVFNSITQSYQSILKGALKFRFIIVLILIGVAAVGFIIYRTMNSEFIPQEDYGVMNIGIVSPTGASMQYTDRYTKYIEKILHKIPQIKNFSTQVAVSSTTIRAVMKPWGERHITTQQVIAKLNPILSRIPGVTAVAQIPDVVNYGEQGSDVTLNFMTTGAYQELLGPINKMMRNLRNYAGLLNVQTNLKFDSQQYSISINRDLAAALGVNIQDIADTVSAMMSGNHWTDVESGSYSYQVLVQMNKEDLRNFNAVKQLYVSATNPFDTTLSSGSSNTDSGSPPNMVPLSSVISLTPSIGQGTLRHFNRLRAGAITAILAPGFTESQVIEHIEKVLPTVLNPNVNYAFSGKAEQYIESEGSMASIMVLAFVFIYLVLSAQFGSFVDPFIILLAVPLSMVGGLFALWLGGGTLNLYSQIGLVTLIGMISKHGILITQFINDLRKKGKDMQQAILEGAAIRFRPVMMTTAAMVFGALPLALATGPGSVGREQIGWVIVGGLVFGTFFSLIVVPIAYSYLAKSVKLKQQVGENDG
ncbi:MAG: efflux RND transporter permease subunit [Gammaproteobacteria bacterium]|nr:efflux RND transporter permease subunit [Gammaproteobacteria bacterium]MCH9744816.1 efflux RND transporter permease subunit [Gammaproteobacteria bacterium]